MVPLGYAMMRMLFRKILLSGFAILIVAGLGACQTKPKTSTASPAKAVAKPQPPKVVDAKAQQLHYDLGVQAYSKENFEEAKVEFQRVIDLGSKTDLAMKALENLKKVIQVLKTVEEITSK